VKRELGHEVGILGQDFGLPGQGDGGGEVAGGHGVGNAHPDAGEAEGLTFDPYADELQEERGEAEEDKRNAMPPTLRWKRY